MKKIQSAFWAGLMLVVAVGVPIFVFVQIWGVIGWIAGVIGLQFIKVVFWNTAIYMVILIAITCLIGWTFKFKFFRLCFDWLMEKIPLASTIAKFIPKHEELEILTDSKLKEVRVEITPGFWLTGLVTKKIKRGGRDFLRVYVATCPVPLTGNLIEVDPEIHQVEYTGGGADDYSALVASFGVRSKDSYSKSSE